MTLSMHTSTLRDDNFVRCDKIGKVQTLTVLRHSRNIHGDSQKKWHYGSTLFFKNYNSEKS